MLGLSKVTAIALVILSVLIAYALYSPKTVDAGATRLGTPQVTLNPGGGVLANGTDGLRFTINADSRYTDEDYDYANEGQDGLVYRSTYQYCCSAGGPMLNIGGQLYGQAGPATSSANWSSIQVISTSGAASVGQRTANTGNSSATIRYTVNKDNLTYTVDRTVNYMYPNDFVTDSYSFIIPEGNSSDVKFYLGGDTAPGSVDQGYGIMLTQPVRSIISLNTSSQIMFGLREIQGSRPFDGATSQHYNAPYSTVRNGGNIGFVETASNHDAGLMMQWNLGSTPGTYTGSFEQFVTQQGTNLNAVFAQPRADIDEGISLNISIVNSELESVNGLGYTISLPSGVRINGTVTTTCGGTLVAEDGSSTVSLTGVSINGASNCVVSAPVSASTPGSYVLTSANASNITGALVNNIGVSRLNVAVYNVSYITQGGESIDDGVYELGNTVTFPSANRAGFIFTGWNTNANGSGTDYPAGSSITMGAQDMSVYAQWEAIPYTVTFDSQGGSSVSTLDNLTAGSEVGLDEPTRAGYQFLEWNSSANGSGVGYDAGDTYTIPAQNSTLYAIWEKVFTLSYNTQGSETLTSQSLTEGNSTWLESAPYREGYNFLEWNTSADGNGTSYEEYDFFTMPNTDITLYAIWEDSDGLSMEIENSAPNGGDANNDGILDSQQAGVSSFVNPVTNRPVSLELSSTDECFLSDVSVKKSDDLATDSAYKYPLGLLDFTVECGNVNGFSATVKQYFYDTAINGFVLRKYLDGQYTTVSGATFDMQTISGHQVLVATYQVKDGGPLDADGIENGTIIDPAGPGLLTVAAASPTSATGSTDASTLVGAPNTGVEPGNSNIFLALSVIGAFFVSLAMIGAIKIRLHRG